MTTAFQGNAFQNNAFQIDGGSSSTGGGGGGYHKRAPRIKYEPEAPLHRHPVDVIFDGTTAENDNKAVRLVVEEPRLKAAIKDEINEENTENLQKQALNRRKLRILAILILLSEAL